MTSTVPTSVPKKLYKANLLDFIVLQFAVGFELIGQVILTFANTLKYIFTGRVDYSETLRQCYMIGVKSVVVVALTALFTGFAMSLQISRELVLFGADTAIGGVVSLALVREIGPITAGVMVAGRVRQLNRC